MPYGWISKSPGWYSNSYVARNRHQHLLCHTDELQILPDYINSILSHTDELLSHTYEIARGRKDVVAFLRRRNTKLLVRLVTESCEITLNLCSTCFVSGLVNSNRVTCTSDVSQSNQWAHRYQTIESMSIEQRSGRPNIGLTSNRGRCGGLCCVSGWPI